MVHRLNCAAFFSCACPDLCISLWIYFFFFYTCLCCNNLQLIDCFFHKQRAQNRFRLGFLQSDHSFKTTVRDCELDPTECKIKTMLIQSPYITHLCPECRGAKNHNPKSYSSSLSPTVARVKLEQVPFLWSKVSLSDLCCYLKLLFRMFWMCLLDKNSQRVLVLLLCNTWFTKVFTKVGLLNLSEYIGCKIQYWLHCLRISW